MVVHFSPCVSFKFGSYDVFESQLFYSSYKVEGGKSPGLRKKNFRPKYWHQSFVSGYNPIMLFSKAFFSHRDRKEQLSLTHVCSHFIRILYNIVSCKVANVAQLYPTKMHPLLSYTYTTKKAFRFANTRGKNVFPKWQPCPLLNVPHHGVCCLHSAATIPQQPKPKLHLWGALLKIIIV